MLGVGVLLTTRARSGSLASQASQMRLSYKTKQEQAMEAPMLYEQYGRQKDVN